MAIFWVFLPSKMPFAFKSILSRYPSPHGTIILKG
jgi:hypothetical protein